MFLNEYAIIMAIETGYYMYCVGTSLMLPTRHFYYFIQMHVKIFLYTFHDYA